MDPFHPCIKKSFLGTKQGYYANYHAVMYVFNSSQQPFIFSNGPIEVTGPAISGAALQTAFGLTYQGN